MILMKMVKKIWIGKLVKEFLQIFCLVYRHKNTQKLKHKFHEDPWAFEWFVIRRAMCGVVVGCKHSPSMLLTGTRAWGMCSKEH
jgi:hypothetical protein